MHNNNKNNKYGIFRNLMSYDTFTVQPAAELLNPPEIPLRNFSNVPSLDIYDNLLLWSGNATLVKVEDLNAFIELYYSEHPISPDIPTMLAAGFPGSLGSSITIYDSGLDNNGLYYHVATTSSAVYFLVPRGTEIVVEADPNSVFIIGNGFYGFGKGVSDNIADQNCIFVKSNGFYMYGHPVTYPKDLYIADVPYDFSIAYYWNLRNNKMKLCHVNKLISPTSDKILFNGYCPVIPAGTYLSPLYTEQQFFGKKFVPVLSSQSIPGEWVSISV